MSRCSNGKLALQRQITVQPWLDGWFLQQKKARDAASLYRPTMAGRLVNGARKTRQCSNKRDAPSPKTMIPQVLRQKSLRNHEDVS